MTATLDGTAGGDGTDIPEPAEPKEPAGPRRPVWSRWFGGRPERSDATDGTDAEPIPPLSPRMQIARAAFIMVAVLSVSLLVELLVLSGVQQRATQQRMFDSFRARLAAGTAPVGPVTSDGAVVAPGTPVAYLEIPAIGLRQVVVQGTTSAVLFDGPGHRVDTPFPGQAGTSIIMGRRASFGGPFLNIVDLRAGDEIRVTTGQGESDYVVTGVRKDGEPVPPTLKSGKGRLTLMTAAGRPFVPDGVVRVDADLVSAAQPGSSVLVAPNNLPAADKPMASDGSTVWALVLWLEALLAASVGFVWAWQRWSRVKAWIVFAPMLLLIGVFVADQGARLLPNMF